VHRRTVAAAVVVALATPLTSAAPAEAATTATLYSGIIFNYVNTADGCSSSAAADYSDSPEASLGFDGSPLSTAWSGSATLTKKSGDTGDQVFLSAAARGTVVGRSEAGRPSSIDVDGTVTTTVTSTRADSACSAFTLGRVRLQGTVELTAPMLVTIGVESDSGVGVQATAGPLRVFTNLRGRQSGTALVPAGAMPVLVDIAQQHYQPPAPQPSTWTGSAQVHITMTPPGSQTARAAGKAAAYVVLPAARSCASHTVTPAVVGKKKKAKQISQVSYYVNDRLVKKVKHPKKGAVVALPVADTEPAEVRAVVRLVRKKDGHKGKELEVAASYAACSG